jgi:Subtilase family
LSASKHVRYPHPKPASAPSRSTARRAAQARYAALSGVLVLCLACAGSPAVSQGETIPTAQAIADNGAFLPFAPRPAQPAGLCLVDTGVNLNRDTESVVVERTAIDGGTGNDVSPSTHGTILAMLAGAPANGWGMIGTAPQSIQIVSVRILEPGQTTFPFAYYTDGIANCLQLQKKYNIKVIDLSLGSPSVPSSQDYQAIANAMQQANNYGVAVVAAAGNDNGGQVDYPAAYPSVLSVGASDTQSGGFCSFSNRGEGLRLLAPGCNLDAADPTSGEADYNYWQGSSESSVIGAASLAALIAHRPETSPQQAEEYLTGAHTGILDTAQAFRNAGLSQLVAEGEAGAARAKPSPEAPTVLAPQSVTPSVPMYLALPFPRPRALLRWIRGHSVLVLTERPNGAQAQVRYLGRRGRARHLTVLGTINAARNTTTIPATGVAEVSVRYSDPYDIQRASGWVTLRVLHLTGFETPKTRDAR